MQDYSRLAENLRRQCTICGYPGDGRDELYLAAIAIDDLQTELQDCRDELCLRCGQYKEKHNGACDGCRWR